VSENLKNRIQIQIVSIVCAKGGPTVEILCLDGDGSFWANRGLKTIKTVSD
jgi:hypothetical protein